MTDTALTKSTFSEEVYRVPDNVLVLIPDAWEKVGSQEEALLSKILGSVRLSLASVRILAVKSLTMDELLRANASKVLSFGVPVAGVANKYEAQLAGEVTVIVADRVIELDEIRKKNLWLSLKQAFSL